MKYEIQNVHVSSIKIGDTIEHENKIVTVGKENIKFSNFMGTTIFGDSYNLGNKEVKKIIIKKSS